MTVIPNAHTKVPMMFRAQAQGRCQVQRILNRAGQEEDIQRWTTEWTWQIDEAVPQFGDRVQTRDYQVNWRLLTNGGQDDTVIRPLLGARGWPFFPGSSMKGLFRRACSGEQAKDYCGLQAADGYEPGSLRFHGGYPTDASWTERLEDIVHPQQDYQVGMSGNKTGALAAISLYRPLMRFGISAEKSLSDSQWQEVWQIWERAIASGLGGRTCAGYGQVVGRAQGTLLFRGSLWGQGAAAKLLDGSGEFRPNLFRAALRGHALRIFGGLTTEESAVRLVEKLFGGVRGGATVGLLGMEFELRALEMGSFGRDRYRVPTYEVTGELRWRLLRELPEEKRRALQRLMVFLTRFAVLLGGFGKSWRRADHRLFFKEYYPNWSEGMGSDRKPLIGCQWDWADGRSLRQGRLKLQSVGKFIDAVRQAAAKWMEECEFSVEGPYPHWREVWHPETVQVWGRRAVNPHLNPEECHAAAWLHGPYRSPNYTIAKSSVTGHLGQVGRLWHRLYAIAVPKDRKADPKTAEYVKTKNYNELLTLFPDGSETFDEFLEFLETRSEFEKLWPLEQ
ncbi:hypothetical protein [Synechococcus sp. PCC 7336]|uniref:hypothetical protein n=1 Tax=Synechococcus sp. PCC 7336 TaxID=195250 RepID=UPI00034806E8|nr:hypothetical protein [Synechococcus sp. PCC 7336]